MSRLSAPFAALGNVFRNPDLGRLQLAWAGIAFATWGFAYPYLMARAQRDLGAWLSDRGRGDEAAAPLEAARVTYARLGVASADQARDECPATSPSPAPA